jgi:mono/diheme cytochrome c family protein
MKNLLIVSTAVSLFCGLLIVADSQNASPAQQSNELARQTFDLLDKRCGQCHGETGSNKDLMLISRTRRNDLVSKRSDGEKKLLVDTEKPEASLLYLRITSKHPNGVMPPAYASNPVPLTPAEQAVVLKWIQAGAPDWKNIQQARPQRHFITNAEILQNISRDLANQNGNEKDTRYFTLTHLYNAGVSDTEIKAYRDGLKRLINSLSWEGDIIIPQAIDPEQTIFRINLKKYGWKASTWQTILQAYPYNIRLSDASFAEVCTTTDCELPFIRADWFVTHAALPPLYHDILELPSGKGSDVQLEKRVLDVRGTRDANQDITESPGERVWRSGFRKSGVSANNRVVEWHTSLYGYYWKSYDFADVTGFQNIKEHPLDFQRAGGEIIFGLPNGLQGYMLVKADGTRLDVAPSNIVSNDRATTKDKQIYNGLSCMGCHTQGMIDGFDIEEVRSAIVNFPQGETRRQGLQLYADRAQMQQLLDDGKKRYRDALAKLNSVAGTNEPIVALAERFQGDVDAELAAAEVGLSTAKFQQIVASLNDPVLNDLKDGKIARKSWEEQISLVVEKLSGARYVTAVQAPLNPQPQAVAKISPEDGATILFDGNGLSAWTNAAGGPAEWRIQDGALVVAIGTGDLVTKAQYQDYQLHVEFNLAYMPNKHGQFRSNSGVFLNGQYEIQILDSVDNPTFFAGGCGAIFGLIDPDKNVCRPPGQWQTYDITFRSPRLDQFGQVVEKPRVTLVWNGVKVHDNVEIDHPTENSKNPMLAAGPIRLQDNRFTPSPVKFRNIWIKPIQ